MRGRAQRERLRRADMEGPAPARLQDPASDGRRWEMGDVGSAVQEQLVSPAGPMKVVRTLSAITQPQSAFPPADTR